MMRALLFAVLPVLLAVFGCSNSKSELADTGAADTGLVESDARPGEVTEPEDAGDTVADVATPPDGLPTGLPFEYTRPQAGEPVSDEEITAFTLEVVAFLKQVRYFDYVLYTTHGVDASTGLPDWQFWYNERFRKEGDKVTFFHPENLNDGGHNLHIPMSRVLGDILAAYLLVGDETMALAATQLCKGMSASMLGMTYDDADDLRHLMSRNVVAHNHEFATHDGKQKAVDYSGWYSPYDRWNCSRFKYENNPYWGEVWVTSMRSKDDVPHIFRLVPNLRYAVAQAGDESLRMACGETLELLEAFARDIVDSGYRIRTKDAEGTPFLPGFTDDPEVNQSQGDLSSFAHYLDVIPNGECNARRASELIGYHGPVNEDCGRGEPNLYDDLAYELNRYNKRICRYFHLAHLANALVNGDNEAAALLMDGLDERMWQEKNTPEEKMKYPVSDWWRNVALYLTQSYTFGFPLQNDEVRLVHEYYRSAIEHMTEWPYWDPWADSVPDGTESGYRPPNCEGPEDAMTCWWRVEDLAQIFEACWTPFANPASARWVDCEVIRDPATWVE